MLVSSGAAMITAAATRSALKRSWRKATGKKPPKSAVTLGVTWPEAVGWAVTTGAVVSLTRLLAERSAAAGWKRVTGKYPRTLRRRRGK